MSASKPSLSAPVTLLWFRKDLRLEDNRALCQAVALGQPILPLYIFESRPAHAKQGQMIGYGSSLGGAQDWWLHHSLTALDTDLKALGSRLIIKTGKPDDVLTDLLATYPISHILWNRRYDPHGMAVDQRLKQTLRESGLTVESHGGHLLHEPSKLTTKAGGPFRVYTPFWKAIEAAGDPPAPLGAPKAIAPLLSWPETVPLEALGLLPQKPNWAHEFTDHWQPGERGAKARLQGFLHNGLRNYRHGRDFPAGPHVSMLSPHIAQGEISPASIWHATLDLPEDIPTEDYVHFRKELVWRDFSYHLLFHFPNLATQNWNPRFDDFGWHDNETAFQAWCKGQTGYPIVDAAMRQLWRHGTMHNRLRMIAASFLIKDLMVDWRRGEEWFRDCLLDADQASNAASWQWVAGSGADAAPYFRIFNPIMQGEKFDPDGTFVRRYVPEIARLPNALIHRPFEAPAEILAKAGIVLGQTYAKPLVNHAQARDTALAAYEKIKVGASE